MNHVVYLYIYHILQVDDAFKNTYYLCYLKIIIIFSISFRKRSVMEDIILLAMLVFSFFFFFFFCFFGIFFPHHILGVKSMPS